MKVGSPDSVTNEATPFMRSGEPTGNLDPETASNIVSLLKEITQQGTAVVMTTHNIPMLDKFPGIVYRCKDGELREVTKEYNRIDLTEDVEEN